MENDSVMAADIQIKFKSGSITGCEVGDTIALSESDFRKLAHAFLAEIEARLS
jgi:hypothetical protein